MKRVKNYIKNLLALSLGIFLAFFLMEGILRLYNPFNFRVKGDKIILPANKKYVIKRDAFGGSSQISREKFDEIIIHSTNSLGFRGEEPPKDFNSYLTILTIGGSTTECALLSEGKTWTDVLGNKLKSHFSNIWINNAGFDGHSTAGHTVLMEDYIVKLKPDIVLFLVGANDSCIEDMSDYDKAMIKNKLMFKSFNWFLRSMANNSEVLSLGLNIYRYYKSNVAGLNHRILDFEMFKNLDQTNYLSGVDMVMCKSPGPEQEGTQEAQRQIILLHKKKFLKGYESRLSTLIKVSKDHFIEPVLITQPAFYGDFIDDVTGINFEFTKHYWDVLELYNEYTRRIGEDNNILVIDLSSEMPKSSKYYYDWMHYTNEGAEKVAEIIYNNLYPYLANKYRVYSHPKTLKY
jgi:lysophospholipase L1-like esterase